MISKFLLNQSDLFGRKVFFQQVVQQFILAGLPKSQTIEGQHLEALLKFLFVSAEGVNRHKSLDGFGSILIINMPEGLQLGALGPVVVGFRKSYKVSPNIGLRRKVFDMSAPKPVRHRSSAQLLFEQLQREGFAGGYDSVRRFVQRLRKVAGGGVTAAFIPLSFDPGEAFQFDWSYEPLEMGGVNVQVKIAHFRLCNSRMPFCVAYPRESLEMVLDAHIRAFDFFGGCCRHGIYDNPKTVVTKVLMGKERVFNRRFLTLASHYLFEPVACTPAAGWEKGQVENQVNLVRQRFFAKRRKFADLAELNQWLHDQCLAHAASHKHPELQQLTVGEAFAEERRHLLSVASAFDGCQESEARVPSSSLVAFDRNSYSVQVRAIGQPVTVRAYAERLVFVQDSQVVGEHPRRFGRGLVVYDPWHYLESLQRKPGALRNGSPFKQWNLPESVVLVREALSRHGDGDRQFVGILAAVPLYGLEAVTQACSEALAAQIVSRDIVLNCSRALRTNYRRPSVIRQLTCQC